MSYDFSDQGALRFSVGADYRSSRHEESDAYQSLGLSRVRVSDQNGTLPIELRHFAATGRRAHAVRANSQHRSRAGGGELR